MKLLKVEIVNFRSIRKVTIDLDPPCRILVGINESGKSNILKALAFLQQERRPVRKDDVRESLPEEDEIKEAFIRFYFGFEKIEVEDLRSRLKSRLVCDTADPEIVSAHGKTVSLSALCAEHGEARYYVNLLDEDKTFRAVNFAANVSLQGQWKKFAKAVPDDFTFEHKGETYKATDSILFDEPTSEHIPETYQEVANLSDFASIFHKTKRSIAEENLFRTILWEYDEKNLLPPQIEMNEFAAEPTRFLPLKNMFELGGVRDISAEISRLGTISHNQAQNFLDRIAAKTTAHFRSVWKEYKDIEFRLRLDGNKIIPAIKERNSFDFSKRSDGFKRFVTFLLMISVNVQTNSLKNALLLIDEADTALHPSGTRYLRDELIRISEKNYVVFSTHSIFMIDTGNIGRHYIVKKESEVTRVEIAKDSNVADEEVLYNALGFSLFEILREKNIIFEGWRDKRLFQAGQSKASGPAKKIFKDVGLCHAKGVKHIKTISPMIELAKRSCLILSDSDQPAKEQRKQYGEEKGFGDWKTYQDVDGALTEITGEDFLKKPFVAAQVTAVANSMNLPDFPVADCPDAGKIKAIEAWFKARGLTDEQTKDSVRAVKTGLFEKITAKDIEDSYGKYLDGVAQLLN
jgi:predicted ATP-dependent endonuclease of OLD family